MSRGQCSVTSRWTPRSVAAFILARSARTTWNSMATKTRCLPCARPETRLPWSVFRDEQVDAALRRGVHPCAERPDHLELDGYKNEMFAMRMTGNAAAVVSVL